MLCNVAEHTIIWRRWPEGPYFGIWLCNSKIICDESPWPPRRESASSRTKNRI